MAGHNGGSTLPSTRSRRPISSPVFGSMLLTKLMFLTSGQTFSGCEEFAYNLQALDRATIVGEQTSGGAHPSDVYRLTDVLEAHIPVARSVNAVTGTNWEGVGVTPDVPCPAAQALDRALAELS